MNSRTRQNSGQLTYRQLLAALQAVPDDLLDEPVVMADPASGDEYPIAEVLAVRDGPGEFCDPEVHPAVLRLYTPITQCYACGGAFGRHGYVLSQECNPWGGYDRLCRPCARGEQVDAAEAAE